MIKAETKKSTTQLQGVTDLTVVAAVKEGEVRELAAYLTYEERLKRVLRVLHSVRQLSREASLQPSPFADSIGQFRGIHFFRFAVVRLDARAHLLLNVTFDGGWESYMRVVWKPLGAFLDLIFCHCEGYPMAFRTDYNQYIRWVREHEVESSFFYADSAATVADEHYLRRLESIQLESGGHPNYDILGAGCALPAQPPNAIPSVFSAIASLRVLTAVGKLREFFPVADDTYQQGPEKVDPFNQAAVLKRFARDLLVDLRSWVQSGLFDPGHQFETLRANLEVHRAWLMTKPNPDDSDQTVKKPEFYGKDVQAGIHQSYPPLGPECGGLVAQAGLLALVRVRNSVAAREWLVDPANVTKADDTSPPKDCIYRNIAITRSGLDVLGIPASDRAALPRDFLEGMEERAGLLGDVRFNHPSAWKRPRRNWEGSKCASFGPPIALSSVHLVLQFRGLESDELFNRISELDSVFDVLFVQEMRLASPAKGEPFGRDHFGYVDGISQPTLGAPPGLPSCWNDQVKTGEIFRGYMNERGDDGIIDDGTKANGGNAADSMLFNGTFLVIRKLRQYPQRLEQLVTDAARRLKPDGNAAVQELLREDIKAKIMGRRTDGTPLVSRIGLGPNDFDYRDDTQGAQCPFQSHIRRANPRDRLPLAFPPRIIRRGMSYEDDTKPPEPPEKGLMFLAYNASIAEQFEVIQRWLAGGNSSGVSSTQPDPLVGVPEVGKPRTYRFVHENQVVRVDLGDKPLVSLEWGLYAFVPSIAALQAIGKWNDSPAASAAPTTAAPAGHATVDWRFKLNDRTERRITWSHVRASGDASFADGHRERLVGGKVEVLDVLKDDGGRFSTCGYGERMRNTVGDFYLGKDDQGANRGHEVAVVGAVNNAVCSFPEKDAFKEALEVGKRILDARLATNRRLIGRPEADIDLDEFTRRVLAELCARWFGLPDGDRMLDDWQPGDDSKPRCPRDLFTVSRSTFIPDPLLALTNLAEERGERVRNAFLYLVSNDGSQRPLTRRILQLDEVRKLDVHAKATIVAGVMLGFPVPTYGNLLFVLRDWVDSRRLWDLQQDIVNSKRKEWNQPDFDDATKLLRNELLKTMRKDPAPYEIWRTEVKPDGSYGRRVVVGLGSAMADGGDHMLMFGGSRDQSSEFHTPHACPGYPMAMGVMLGAATALLTAGALRPTPDPVVVTVTALDEKADGAGNGKPDSLQPANKEIPRRPL